MQSEFWCLLLLMLSCVTLGSTNCWQWSMGRPAPCPIHLCLCNYLPLLASFLASLHLCLYICWISRLKMPATIGSLKVILSPCRDEVGLNVIRNPGSVASAWPKKSKGVFVSRGLMKTNPSLCCCLGAGQRAERWQGAQELLCHGGRWRNGRVSPRMS